MKYGVLVHKGMRNIGDDIQSYAEAKFLPRVDMMVDREQLANIQVGDGKEPVAVIMGAWFMWHKYNWPPSKQIIPLMVSYHHFEREKETNKVDTYCVPIFKEHYNGIGGEWLKAYGPIGCRDLYTCNVLDEQGIPNYFSGCVTLTLPKQRKTEECGEYICLVDLSEDVEAKVRELIGNKYKIKKISHSGKRKLNETWEERAKDVEDLLTIYQNAKYVVTRRLHVALPCLAMEVPVLVVQGYVMNDHNRFDPYNKWLHYYRDDEFLKKGYKEWDWENGTPNKKDYLETREKLTKTMKDYIDFCEANKDKPLEFFCKTQYTETELLKWRVNFLNETLFKTHIESKRMFNELRELKKQEPKLRYIISKRIYNKFIKNSKLKKLKIVNKIKKRLKNKK